MINFLRRIFFLISDKPYVFFESIFKVISWPYDFFDRLYIKIDRDFVAPHYIKPKGLNLIPRLRYRIGGLYSYGLWSYLIGVFQVLIFDNIQDKDHGTILDFGCGTGFLAIASEPLVRRGVEYIGIDVRKRDINFCQDYYNMPRFKFIHHNVYNAFYASNQRKVSVTRWPLADNSVDLVVAKSVWTHLDKDDAMFYFGEVNRVLKNGGRAIITLHLIEEGGGNNLFFNKNIRDSGEWLTTMKASLPEMIVAITSSGLKKMVLNTNMKLIKKYDGEWRGGGGIFFQDILIFKKQ